MRRLPVLFAILVCLGAPAAGFAEEIEACFERCAEMEEKCLEGCEMLDDREDCETQCDAMANDCEVACQGD
jgi:hypothetical protein